MRSIVIGMAAYAGSVIALPRDDSWRDHRDAYKDREYRAPRRKVKRTKRRRK